MVNIELRGGEFALIDEEDYELVRRFKWREVGGSSKYTSYASTSIRIEGVSRTVLMHRLLLRAKPGEVVDHADGNGLNNQRDNIRITDHSGNGINQRLTGRGTSRFKGVSWSTERKAWQATIIVKGERTFLGYFGYEEEAARAYNAAAIRQGKEFARPNIVTPTGGLAGLCEVLRLTPLETQVLLLHVDEGLAYYEVAERVGLTRREVEEIAASIGERGLDLQADLAKERLQVEEEDEGGYRCVRRAKHGNRIFG